MQAALLLGCGEAADADACCRRALRIRQDLYGPDSREVSAAKCTLADTLRELGRYARAVQALVHSSPFLFHRVGSLAHPNLEFWRNGESSAM